MTKLTFVSLAAALTFIAGSATAGPDPSMRTRDDRVDDRVACIDGREQAAVAACTRLIGSGSLATEDLAAAFYNRARHWADIREFDSAIRDLNEVIRLFPQDAETFNARGLAYLQKNDNERAISDFDRAIALDPNYAPPLTNRGLAHQNSGRLERAIQDYDQSIRLNPNSSLAFTNRGSVYMERGELDRAIQDFDQAISLDPRQFLALLNRGLTFAKLGQCDRVLKDQEEMARISPAFAGLLEHTKQSCQQGRGAR